MTHRVFTIGFSTFIGFCLFASCCKADIILPIVYDEVISASTTDLTMVAQSPDKPWAVVEILPDPVSGEPHTRDFPGKPSRTTITASGTYRVLSQLGYKIQHDSGTYNWPVTSFATDYISGAKWDMVAPFQYVADGKKRYAICQIHEDQTGEDIVSDIHRIPTGWQNEFGAAVTYLKAHPGLGTTNSDAAQASELRKLLSNPNSCLALAAAKILTGKSEFTTTDMHTILVANDPKLIASAVSISALSEWSKTDKPITQYLENQTPKLTSLDQLEGISMGLAAASRIAVTPSVYGITGITPESERRFKTPIPKTASKALPANQFDVSETSIVQVVKAVRQRLVTLTPVGSPAGANAAITDVMCRYFDQ